MASAALGDELTCSICLNLYKEPVFLNCGHNFCQECIVTTLETQERSGTYSCPECRAEYVERPTVEKNRKLCNIVQNFISTQTKEDKGEIFCTYCVDSPTAAIKTCVQCETSMCEKHLTAHNKTVDHVLMEPTSSFSGKKCSIHKKLLEYYCSEDSVCLCVSCCLVGKHKGHEVELLEDAFEKKKEKLRNVLEKLTMKRKATEQKIQNLQNHKRKVQKKEEDEKKRITTLFEDFRKQLEVQEQKVLSEISRQVEEVSLSVIHLTKKLKIQKDKLSRNICHIEKICNITDPIIGLQAQETDTEKVKQDPGPDTKNVQQDSGPDTKTVQQDPGPDTKNVQQDSGPDTKTVQQDPGPDTKNVQQDPGPDTKTVQQDPGPDTKTVQQDPAPDTKKVQQDPGPDTKKVQQDPGPDTKKVKQDPGPDTKTVQQDPGPDTKNVQQDPGPDTKTVQQDPGPNTKNVQQDPGPDTKNVQQDPGPDTKTVQQDPGPDTKTVQQDPGPDTKTVQQDPGPDTKNVQQYPGPDTKKVLPSPGSDTGVRNVVRSSVLDLDLFMISLVLHRSITDLITNLQLKDNFIVQESPDLLLDEKTANEFVTLSNDLRTASESEIRIERPPLPERFTEYSQVMSVQRFSGGRHYWEVEVSDFGQWDVAVCYPSIPRDGDESGIGCNNKSWSFCIDKNKYNTVHNSVYHMINVESPVQKVGVYLDYEAGRLSYYLLCDPVRHLHTFTTSFSEPLHAAFYLFEGGWVRLAAPVSSVKL